MMRLQPNTTWYFAQTEAPHSDRLTSSVFESTHRFATLMSPIPQTLVEQVKNKNGSFSAQLSKQGIPFPNIQNNGLKKGQCAVRHKNGGYHQFAIRAEEDIPPLLTQIRVVSALEALNRNDIAAAAEWLTVKPEFDQQGESVVFSALCLWLKENNINLPTELKKREQGAILSDSLRNRLLLTRKDTVPFSISIAAIGCVGAEGTSVVPEDWMGKVFNNGEQLCRAIDKLPHRQGLPPAEYCTHYGLKIVSEPRWLTADAVDRTLSPEFGVSITKDGEQIKTSILPLSPSNLDSWISQQTTASHFLIHEFAAPGSEDAALGRTLIIACTKSKICESVPSYQSGLSVGLLASKLQKCIRLGRRASKALEETVDQMRRAAPYNLPDDHFKRSSGSRQLAWRLFISIFEDAKPYADAPNGEYLGMQDLLALSILAHAAPDLQFNAAVGNKFKYTARLVQQTDAHGDNWNWRKGGKKTKILPDSPFERMCAAAETFMPMMKRDSEMLRQGCDYLRTTQLALAPLRETSPSDETAPPDDHSVITSAHDFHCCPAILLYLQASLPSTDCELQLENQPNAITSTQNLKRFIWENVSRINVRNPNHRPARDPISQSLCAEIRAIQTSLALNHPPALPKLSQYPAPEYITSEEIATPSIGRSAFIALFGQSIDLPKASSGEDRQFKHAFTAVAAGQPDVPFKIKIKKAGAKHSVYLSGDDRRRGEQDLVAHLAKTHGLDIPIPPSPAGYCWRFETSNPSVRIQVVAEKGETSFSVNGVNVPAFNASALLKKRDVSKPVSPAPNDANLVANALYIPSEKDYGAETQWLLNQTLRFLAQERRKNCQPIFQWTQLAQQSPLPPVVWQRAYTKLLSTVQGRVTIGPVDRNGDKTFAAVDYLHEGVLWRIFNLLSFLFPDCVHPSSDLDFAIDNQSPSYTTLIQDLELLASPKVPQVACNPAPTVKTPLWQHQASSKSRILHELLTNNRRGFGDASDVGAGKTLTTLAIMCELAQHQRTVQNNSAEAFLVLVYNEALVETWKNEINKHTEGFHFITQNSSGELSDCIRQNSVLVTTLGRMRDTPVTRRWHIVVIDECLSVQNADALWTQEAWKQVACSRHGVLLLSATLFRSRFNELFYLLRMLRTGLPESREYLDAILAESITCHLPEKTDWHWTEETRLFALDPQTRNQYNHIKAAHADPRSTFGRLDALLAERFPFERHVEEEIRHIENQAPNRRALVFARSNEEAELISNNQPTIGLYPDISKRHVISTTAVAARGVNNLVHCDTLITRPVDPDLVPQMRGRLGRPGQKNPNLHWVWIVAEDTLEETKLERNKMAEQFHGEYIMPLAELYKRALE